MSYTGIYETSERVCKHCGPTLYRRNSQGNWICNQCCKNRTVKHRVRRKEILVEERGNKCERCGYADLRALEWHHPERLLGNRTEYVSVQDRGLEANREHLANCELLCANCHKIEHHREFINTGPRGPKL
jgi:hypothetical protein